MLYLKNDVDIKQAKLIIFDNINALSFILLYREILNFAFLLLN